ncbi:hypothetical protein PFISCL1PPCAC_23934 [Pristionchus fissidentatus]|uniref:Uncharacterized protein n=1 Tax=Pristionchus fissidentatus TaxID=1538716 RepID=A0AAV5WSC2_9BILA|nr:hypothetical protein PFISCL1PPCAC_23934 [Pristionchus fissidentatus]
MDFECDSVSIVASISLGLPIDSLPNQGMAVQRRRSLVEALRHSIDMDSFSTSHGIFDIRQILDQHPDIDIAVPIKLPPLPPEENIEAFKQRAASVRLRRRPKRSKSEPLSTTDSDEDYDCSPHISRIDCITESEWNRRSLNSTTSSMTHSSTSSTSSLQSTLAEAISDHVAVLSDELPFARGDTITVIDTTSPSGLWYGTCRDSHGWFPASYVTIISSTSSTDSSNDCVDDANNFPEPMRRQRAKAVEELLKTERDYVQLLDNLVHGFLEQTHRRADLFPRDTVDSIFCNIGQLLGLHVRLLRQLEMSLDPLRPEDSMIGGAFLRHKQHFTVYAPYCNNRPLSCAKLANLTRQPIYHQFFDACRLLRGMPHLSLEAFLLTPVQRICRYPLQLQQIYKVTPAGHADRHSLSCAVRAMKEVACQLDERRRRIESIQAISLWQSSLHSWKGPDLIEKNSLLIKSGDAMCRCVAGGNHWAKQITLFLFDQTLVLCKKDVFSRNSFVFKERISLSSVSLHDVHDGKEQTFHVSVKNSFRLVGENRHYLFSCPDAKAKEEWLRSFSDRSQLPPPATADEKRLALSTMKLLRISN